MSKAIDFNAVYKYPYTRKQSALQLALSGLSGATNSGMGMLAVLGAISLLIDISGAQTTTILIQPERPHQKFEGWGTSLCWWANGAGRWTDVNLDRLLGYVSDPDSGLGCNVFRYNIGGGDRPGHNHMGQYRDISGYKPTETEPYNWSADPYQRKVAAKLAARLPNAIFEAFSNSPPWWMTKSGCAGGNPDGSDNLKLEYFYAFSDYLSEVTKHFRDAWGITFRTVAPFNEPSARWWTGPDKSQEGCGFRDNQPRMIKLLGKSLTDKSLQGTTISAADENSIADEIRNVSAYDDPTLALVSQLNTHSYNGKDRRADLAALAAKDGKRLWQSESGPLSWPGGNLMDVSLWMADVIIKDLRDLRANAWVDWQLLDGGVWGSFITDYGRQTARPNKRFYMQCNFSRFIRPGATILESNGGNTIAAMVPSTGNLVVVFLNAPNAATEYSLDVSHVGTLPATAACYRTSTYEDLATLPGIPVANGRLQVTLMARSITTFVLHVASGVGSISPDRNGFHHLRKKNYGSHFTRILYPIQGEARAVDAKGTRIGPAP